MHHWSKIYNFCTSAAACQARQLLSRMTSSYPGMLLRARPCSCKDGRIIWSCSRLMLTSLSWGAGRCWVGRWKPCVGKYWKWLSSDWKIVSLRLATGWTSLSPNIICSSATWQFKIALQTLEQVPPTFPFVQNSNSTWSRSWTAKL